MTISISTTSFNSKFHSSQKAGNNTYGFYVLHNVDVYNEIEIDGQVFCAIYQPGQTYDHNDYSCPSESLSLSTDGGADEVLVKIYDAGDFDDSEESDIEELLEELKEDYSLTLTLEDLRAVYQAITDNQNMADQKLESMELSDDLDDYSEDESSGLLELKKYDIEIVISSDTLGDENTDEDNQRFIDAVEKSLKEEYPHSTVDVELSENVTEGSENITGAGCDEGEELENIKSIIDSVWSKANY